MAPSAARLTAALNDTVQFSDAAGIGPAVALRAGVGCATGADPDLLLHEADMAMYVAKKAGAHR